MRAVAYSSEPLSVLDSLGVDEQGIPQMPEDLFEYIEQRDMIIHLDTEEGRDLVQNLADQVYEMWKHNDFKPVKIMPEPDYPAPSCYGVSPKEAVIFDEDWPEPDDYSNDADYQVAVAEADMRVAQAKKKCADCPFKLQCLASSITHEVRGRDHQVDGDRVGYERVGIWGGYGVGSREAIWEKMVDRWAQEYREGIID